LTELKTSPCPFTFSRTSFNIVFPPSPACPLLRVQGLWGWCFPHGKQISHQHRMTTLLPARDINFSKNFPQPQPRAFGEVEG